MVRNSIGYPGVGSPSKNVAPTVAKVKSKKKLDSSSNSGTLPGQSGKTVPGPGMVSLPVVNPLDEEKVS